MNLLRNFLHDGSGQDLIEYTLLMAFVALASAALFLGAGGNIQGIWQTSNVTVQVVQGSQCFVETLDQISGNVGAYA